MSVRICILDSACVSPDISVVRTFGDAEKERLEKIRNPIRRRESEAGLVALHRALGGRESCDIVRDKDGRPHFRENIGLDFNISHSGVLCMAAVCDAKVSRVGVDIEHVNEEKRNSLVRIAKRYFDLKELCGSESVTEYYKLWTAKEAESKLIGSGLSGMLGKKECVGVNIGYSHYLVQYAGKRYVLCLCTEGQSEIEFICDEGIVVEPFAGEMQ